MVRNIVLTGLTIALLTGCSSKKEENGKAEYRQDTGLYRYASG